MTAYRRIYISGAAWFFTVNLAKRKKNDLLINKIDLLREAFRYTKQRHPFDIDAAGGRLKNNRRQTWGGTGKLCFACGTH